MLQNLPPSLNFLRCHRCDELRSKPRTNFSLILIHFCSSFQCFNLRQWAYYPTTEQTQQRGARAEYLVSDRLPSIAHSWDVNHIPSPLLQGSFAPSNYRKALNCLDHPLFLEGGLHLFSPVFHLDHPLLLGCGHHVPRTQWREPRAI